MLNCWFVGLNHVKWRWDLVVKIQSSPVRCQVKRLLSGRGSKRQFTSLLWMKPNKKGQCLSLPGRRWVLMSEAVEVFHQEFKGQARLKETCPNRIKILNELCLLLQSHKRMCEGHVLRCLLLTSSSTVLLFFVLSSSMRTSQALTEEPLTSSRQNALLFSGFYSMKATNDRRLAVATTVDHHSTTRTLGASRLLSTTGTLSESNQAQFSYLSLGLTEDCWRKPWNPNVKRAEGKNVDKCKNL